MTDKKPVLRLKEVFCLACEQSVRLPHVCPVDGKTYTKAKKPRAGGGGM